MPLFLLIWVNSVSLYGMCQLISQSPKAESLTTHQEEAQRLRAQNTTLTRRGQHQHEEIKRLNKVRVRHLQCCCICCYNTGGESSHNITLYSVLLLSKNGPIAVFLLHCLMPFPQALEEACQFSVPPKEGSGTQEQLWKHQVGLAFNFLIN